MGTGTVFCCHSDKNIFGELLDYFEIQNGYFQAKNYHFKAFLIQERQEGNKRHSKMDENKFTSTVYCCHSDKNIFGDILGHFKAFLIKERQEGKEGYSKMD